MGNVSKKFFVKQHEQRENDGILLTADRMAMDDSFIYVYNGEELVGIFDRGNVKYCYLSEQKRKDNRDQYAIGEV